MKIIRPNNVLKIQQKCFECATQTKHEIHQQQQQQTATAKKKQTAKLNGLLIINFIQKHKTANCIRFRTKNS